jgi:hypothetical protein
VEPPTEHNPYKRVPHITLKSIANNEEIDVIHAKWQEKLEPVRKELNKALGTKWEEWQVPRPNVIARVEDPKQSESSGSEIASLESARNGYNSQKVLLEFL